MGSLGVLEALRFRMGINLGDIIIEDDGDIYGDGVNVATRLEQIAEPGSVCISGKVFDEIEGKLSTAFAFTGEQQVKNLTRAVRVYSPNSAPRAQPKQLPLPDKPFIAVLPFTNMSGDPEQEYFADGIVEDIITALSRPCDGYFVIARNSSFTYKGRAVDINRSDGSLGYDTSLREASGKAGTASASQHSFLTQRTEAIFGLITTMGSLPISSICRTALPKASSGLSSRASVQARSSEQDVRGRTVLTPTIS